MPKHPTQNPSKIIPRLILSACLSLLLITPLSAEPELLGPMLGAVEMAEARIWLQSSQTSRFRIQYWAQNQPAQKFWTEARSSHAESEHALTMVLGELHSGTTYRYRVERDGQLLGSESGYSFTTQTDWIKRSDPPAVKIALGSCVYLDDPVTDPPGGPLGGDYGIFEQIAQTQPQLMLWLGDNVYLRPADFYSRAAISRRYRQLRRLPELQNLLHSTAHYAIWDDHDYGDNDSDRSYRLRPDSLDMFRQYWANPAYGTPEQAGVFSRFIWSDVEFFLTDNRYYRAPNKLQDPNKAFFGPGQLQWLKDSLSASTATFKLVAIGNQVLNLQTPTENYYSYQGEYREFLDWLAKSRIPGVVIISGDRHHSEFLKLSRPGTYPLYEWTVSPLTSKAYPPFEPEQVLPAREPGSLLSERNFGLIEVSGPAKARSLRLELRDAKGQSRWTRQIQASELQPPDQTKAVL